MGFISRRLSAYPTILLIYRFVKRAVLTLFIAHFIYTIALIWMPVFSTPTIFGEWITGKTIQKQWVSRAQMSGHIQKAVIASEDQEFGEHFGFDIEAIEKAVQYNKTHTKKKGASTISQQVAKNVFLWQGRTWLRKGLEVYCTLMIELFWSKDRILEVYLNVAEMGDGIYGVEAAAQVYFKKTAADLSKDEGALIAACLPSPKKYRVDEWDNDFKIKEKDSN
jgi:monofunctional glycosyltransferase